MNHPAPHGRSAETSSNAPPPQSGPEQQHLTAEAQRWVRRLRVLYTILGIYAVLSLMWFAIDMADGTESLWFYWPMLGTGLVVAVTAIVMVGVGGPFGADWENRQVQRYLHRHQPRNDTAFLAPPPPSTNSLEKNDRKEARP